MALKPARLQWSGDGAVRSADFGDIYFQPGAGAAESRYVFLDGNRLPERFARAQGAFHVAELGFGSGLNFLLAAQLWRERAQAGARLYYAAVEKHPLSEGDLRKVLALWPEHAETAAALLRQYPPPVAGFHHVFLPGIRLSLLLGDVGDILPQLAGKFDAWFLDGFAPAKNPGMWDEKLFPLIAARTKPGGTLSTFSAAGAVRRGLAAAGFLVEKAPGFGPKRDMTVAVLRGATAEKTPPAVATVVGAGLAGCAAARALAERGVRVTLADRHGGPAREASGNAAGVLYPKPLAAGSPLYGFHNHGFCFSRARVLALQLPAWRECGVLHAGFKNAAALIEKNGWPEEYARTAESGLLQPLAGFLSPPALCAALLDHPGITPVYGRDAALGTTEITIIAAGMNARAFAPAAWLPLSALRGQVSFVAAEKTLEQVVCHAGGYVTPEKDGMHCIGATFQREEYGENPQPRAQDDADNISRLRENMPEFAAARLLPQHSRAGFRATTPDKLPLIGPLPDRDAFAAGEPLSDLPGLFISAGFGAHGLSGAPLAGEIVASLICGDPLPVPLDLLPFLLPERFLIRARRRRLI